MVGQVQENKGAIFRSMSDLFGRTSDEIVKGLSSNNYFRKRFHVEKATSSRFDQGPNNTSDRYHETEERFSLAFLVLVFYQLSCSICSFSKAG